LLHPGLDLQVAGPFIKNVRSQGGVQGGHFADKGGWVFFRCERPQFLAQKLRILWCVRTNKGRGELS